MGEIDRVWKCWWMRVIVSALRGLRSDYLLVCLHPMQGGVESIALTSEAGIVCSKLAVPLLPSQIFGLYVI